MGLLATLSFLPSVLHLEISNTRRTLASLESANYSVRASRPHHAQTPPPSSYAEQAFDINITELVRRIGLDDDEPLTEQPQVPPAPQPSPVSTLPPEVLSHIFACCIPQEQFPVPCSTEAPLLLSHVSGYWRDLTLALPHLWTALHINYKDPASDIAFASLWLSRSGNQLLNLSIAIDFNERPQQGIIDVLCRHAPRWKHVRFDFRHLFCEPMYSLDLAQNNIPNLKAFEFHARDVSNTNVWPVTHLLSSAPQLREITWVDDLADTDTLLELPLYNLTHLSLAMDHGSLDYLEVLEQCENLEHIRISRPFSHTPAGREPLVLPKLKSVNISYDLTNVLDHLVLPGLREVMISSDGDKQIQVQPHSYSQSLPHLPPLPHAYAEGPVPASASTPSIAPSEAPVDGWDPTGHARTLLAQDECLASLVGRALRAAG
ncbi:hypothetical protein NLJ89_g10283 [Agrocybe chaxingu]|uniref:F-box domain-containing protein n=1 Tax=Agrocybe chaxingu TaxID=84603 RepID=A0A9W8MSS5_9AGAR|nr:hypothetical protein NLJ89_g10283 [Agrocybe chaxingu]